MTEDIYDVISSIENLKLVGYGTKGTCNGLQQYASYAGPDVTVGAKEIQGFIRFSDGKSSFDVLVAEGSGVDGRANELYMSSRKVDVADHLLERPKGLGLDGSVLVRKLKGGDAVVVCDRQSYKAVIVVGAGYKKTGAVFPLFEVDVVS